MSQIPPEPNEDESNICECCGYVAPLKEYQRCVPPLDQESHKFCEICASTFLSHCVTYASLYGSERHLWSSIGWIANLLRDEIRRAKE